MVFPKNYIRCIAGGSLAKFLTKGLPSISTDWSKWLIFFCDERHVDFKNEDSTYKLYKESLLTKVDLKDEQIIKINPELSGILLNLLANYLMLLIVEKTFIFKFSPCFTIY